MQDVKFRSIDDFLDYLPEDELKMTILLRDIVYNCLPQVSEKLAYNVPFFKHHRNFCFIWPASILWGKTKSYQGVRLGFTNGHLMQDERKYLDRGKRKQVYWKDFKHMSEIDIELVRSYIYEAIMIDEQLGKTVSQKI